MLHCGNCVDFMLDMASESVDLTVTSPPYDDLRTYNGYTFDFEAIAKGLYRITKQGGVVVWVVADQTKKGNESGTSFRQALYFQEMGFNLYDTMIWEKSNTMGANQCYYQCFEYMFVFSKGIPKTINLICDRPNIQAGKIHYHQSRLRDGTISTDKNKTWKVKPFGKRTNIWKYAVGYGCKTADKIAYEHPAIFPEKLAEDHILSWSNPGDLVLDPMMGSGTTGKMALKHNRKFIGIDISDEYVEIARQRIDSLQCNLLLDVEV